MSKLKSVFAASEAPHALNDFFKADRSASVAFTDWGPSLTRQEFAEEADINVLMARFERTGIAPVLPGHEPLYLDLTELPGDFQTAMQRIIDAEHAFMKLPALVRKEFDNDAAQFVDFACDPANLGQMRTWGLAPPEAKPPEPQLVRVVPEPASPEPPQEAAKPGKKP